jgi:uncharacterized protein (DUF1800 family)
MKKLVNRHRNWQKVFLLFGLFFFVWSVSGQEFTDSAPVLISQPDSTRALTAKPSGKGLIAEPTVFSPSEKTLVTFFVTNLDLLENEDARAFRADVQDSSKKRYPLKIVSFEPLEDRPWVYAVTARLNPRLERVGDVLLRLNWRGLASNRVRLAIGFEGGKLEDDPGAKPTPMPENPPTKSAQSENLVRLPWNGNSVRFMEQATFGPNAAQELRLRRIGISTWLNEQMEEKRDASGALRYSTFPYPNLPLQQTPAPSTCTGTCLRDNYTMYPLQNWFFKESLYGEDQQLRRRVSWALSQIWVVSGRETVQPSRMLPYLQVLDRNAFGNYRDLMREMTLNPAMGNYLDMAISTRQSPNENYAREILQLFSIGLYMLNQDGTLQLDGQGNPISTYTQAEVNGFTKLFTGWTFCNVGCPNSAPGIVNYRDPLIINPANHDSGEKQVLSYPGSIPMIPAGQTSAEDFEQGLDNIFYHPNVAPFVSKLLIQQLVTSNPTPPYVERVANVFNNNGQGIRGDLKAVVRAILTDVEARGNIKTDPDYGKLREPVLFVTNILRPFSPVPQIGAPVSCKESDGVINGATLNLDQDVFNPPSVFNYYPMDYVLQNTNLLAPEFGIFSTGTALKRPNFVNQMVFGDGITRNGDTPCGTRIVMTKWQSLAEADTSGQFLVDTLNREFMHGSMSLLMREHILTAVQTVPVSNSLKRARTALYLATTSPQFQVQR